jgi:hypothetical protein
MPRYYFHVHDAIDTLDEEGLELRSAEQACELAVRAASELAVEDAKRGELEPDHRIEVADEIGSHVSTVMFRDFVEVQGRYYVSQTR